MVQADRNALATDGRGLSFISITITDAAGVEAPRSADQVRFSVTSPGDIVATDNGDATSFESFQAPSRRAYNGKCLAIVRTRPGGAGEITVRAESEGLQPADVVVQSR